ncbi:MAG: helix-turn-helix domain-containing protein [Acidimicrobiia bacterium]|nr:helix-turn-helix domain-containing protein [Acidimicrobiia bacterium]
MPRSLGKDGSVRTRKEAMERETLPITKACQVVGVSRRTIYNWIASGKVQYVRTAGGAIRIFADSLWREPQERRPSPVKSGPEAGLQV